MPTGYGFKSEHGRTFATRAFKLDSGWVNMSSRWLAPLSSYVLNYRNRSLAEIDQVRAFFFNHYGSGSGFRFLDKTDNTSAANHRSAPAMTDHSIVMVSGAYRLAKKYDLGGTEVIRLIYKPIAGTVLISDAGVDVTSSVTINTTTGILTGYVPSGAYKAGFRFYTPARFNVDQLVMAWDDYNNVNIEGLGVEELRLS